MGILSDELDEIGTEVLNGC